MSRIDRNASLEEKLEHIMREIRLAGYETEITADEVENIIAFEWGHNRLTIETALRFLKSSKRLIRKSPKVYRINVPTYTTKRGDETAAEELFIAKTIEQDLDGMICRYQERHPKGMKGGPSQDQDIHWIRATREKYGLQDMRARDLFHKLLEGLA